MRTARAVAPVCERGWGVGTARAGAAVCETGGYRAGRAIQQGSRILGVRARYQGFGVGTARAVAPVCERTQMADALMSSAVFTTEDDTASCLRSGV